MVTVRNDTRTICWNGNEDERESRPAHALEFSQQEHDPALVLPQHAQRDEQIEEDRKDERECEIHPRTIAQFRGCRYRGSSTSTWEQRRGSRRCFCRQRATGGRHEPRKSRVYLAVWPAFAGVAAIGDMDASLTIRCIPDPRSSHVSLEVHAGLLQWRTGHNTIARGKGFSAGAAARFRRAGPPSLVASPATAIWRGSPRSWLAASPGCRKLQPRPGSPISAAGRVKPMTRVFPAPQRECSTRGRGSPRAD